MPELATTPGQASNQDAWPAASYAWFVVSILALAYTVSFIDRQILSLLVEPIRQNLSLSDTQIGLLQGPAFAIFYSVMGVPIAIWSDRGNRRNIIIIGITLWCIATALCGLADNFQELFLARILVGVGEAALSPPAYSMIADYFPPARLARATGVYSLGVYSGAGIALLVGGQAIAALGAFGEVAVPGIGVLQSWQVAFLVVGLPGILVAVLMLAVREPVRRGAAAQRSKLDARKSLRELWRFLGTQRRAFVTLCVGFCFLGIVMIGILSWTPTYLIRVHQWSPGEVGFRYGLVLLFFGTTGSFAGGWIADRLHHRGKRDTTITTSITVSLLAMPFAVGMALAPSGTMALLLLAPTSFLLASPVGLSAAAIQLMTPNAMRAQVTALYLLVVALVGTGFGPLVVALCTDHVFGDPLAVGRSVALVSAVLLPAGALTLWLGIRRPHYIQHA